MSTLHQDADALARLATDLGRKDFAERIRAALRSGHDESIEELCAGVEREIEDSTADRWTDESGPERRRRWIRTLAGSLGAVRARAARAAAASLRTAAQARTARAGAAKAASREFAADEVLRDAIALALDFAGIALGEYTLHVRHLPYAAFLLDGAADLAESQR